jgi:hypothetical protein
MNPIRHGISGGSARTIWRVLGLVSVLAGIVCFVLAGPLLVRTFEFAERYLSPDQHITLGIDYVGQLLMLFGACLLGIGIAIALRAAALCEMIAGLVASYSNLTGKQFSLSLLWSSSLTGLLLVALRFLGNRMLPSVQTLHGEDGPFEMMTAILFIVSSFLLFGAAMAHRRQRAVDHRKVVAALLAGIGIVFLFFGLEEISWGQRLFGWSTPAVLQQINDQGELNIHNLDNSLIDPLYRGGIAVFALVTVAGWLWISRFKKTPLRFLIPHGATAGLLVLMLLFGALWQTNELLEELGAVFALSYSLAALRMSKPRHLVA